MLAYLYLVRFAHLVGQDLCLSCQLPMPSASAALLRLKADQVPSTTGEGRLKHNTSLHVHKELAHGMDKVEAANLFVGDNHRRKN